MKLRIKLFAVAKELAGADEIEIELPAGATVADVRQAVEKTCPALTSVLPRVLWAVDAAYAADAAPLSETSDVAIIPPISGG